MASQTKPIRVPPSGTKGPRVRGGSIFFRLAQPFVNWQVGRYQKAPGPEASKFMGFPVLLLTTVGAKSGKEHTHVLGGFPDGEDAWLVIASKGGSATHPHWFHNIVKHPDKVWFQVGNRKRRAHVESLQGADREAAYQRVVAVAKGYGEYLKKTDREIPVLRLTLAPE